jgi:HlyD family secretion protein
VEVGTEVSGKIEKLYKDYNDNVRKGETLAKLDTELLRTSLESSKAICPSSDLSGRGQTGYGQPQGTGKRNMAAGMTSARPNSSISKPSRHLPPQVNLQRAQKNLDNAFITSPIDGVIVARSVDEGHTVAPASTRPPVQDSQQPGQDADYGQCGRSGHRQGETGMPGNSTWMPIPPSPSR